MKKPARKKITAALLCAALSWQGCVYAQQTAAETAKETEKTLEALYPAPEALVLLNSNGTLGIMPLVERSGEGSIQEGNGANASGENSIAFGTNAMAKNENAIAIGRATDATGQYATAIGWDADATAQNATAVGNRSKATAAASTAIGSFSKATGVNSTAVGNAAWATNRGSIAVGNNVNVSAGTVGEYSIAIGNEVDTSGNSAVAIGSGASGSATNATAIGANASVFSENSVAIGANSYVSTANTVSFGRMTNYIDNRSYRNLEGIEDIYVNGGIIFTADGAGSNTNLLQQGELRGVTKINGVLYSSYTNNNTYSIGNIVFGADGTNVQSINGIRFGVDSASNTYSIGNIVFSANNSNVQNIGNILFDSSGNVTSINGTNFSDLVNANHDLSSITGDIESLKSSVGEITDNVGSIKDEIGSIGSEITNIKTDITNIKNDIGNSSGNVDGENIKPGSVTVGDAANGTQTVIDSTGTVMTKNEGGFTNTTTMDGSSTVMIKTDGSTTSTTTTEAGSIKVSSETTGIDGSKEASSVSIAGGDIELSKTGADGKQQTIKVGEEISSIRGDMDSMRSDINSMGRSIDRLGEEIDEVGALSAALAGLHPNPINANSRADFAMAVGSYDGESAIAAGAFYRPDKRTMLSLGASATSGNQMFNMGVTFALDKLPEKENTNSEVLQAVLARLDKLEAENAELKAQVAAQKEADNA